MLHYASRRLSICTGDELYVSRKLVGDACVLAADRAVDAWNSACAFDPARCSRYDGTVDDDQLRCILERVCNDGILELRLVFERKTDMHDTDGTLDSDRLDINADRV